MLALVTGGGGFLGSSIADKLVSQGNQVRILGRNRYQQLEKLGCDCICGDIRDPDLVGRACDGVDAVFHVAALAGVWGKRRDFFEINYSGTLNIIAACESNRCGKLVYTSSPSVIFGMEDLAGVNESHPYPNRFNADYPESKAEAEKAVLAANGRNGVATCSIRPHLIWGPGDTHIVPTIIDRARNGRLVQVGDGTNLTDITYIDHAAIAHIQAAAALSLDSPVAGNAYFVGDSEPVQFWSWVSQLLAGLDLPPVTKRIPYPAAYCVGAMMELVFGILRLDSEPRLTRFVAGQLAKSHYFDHGKAERDFGYNPTVSPETGMKRTIEWFRRQGE